MVWYGTGQSNDRWDGFSKQKINSIDRGYREDIRHSKRYSCRELGGSLLKRNEGVIFLFF